MAVLGSEMRNAAQKRQQTFRSGDVASICTRWGIEGRADGLKHSGEEVGRAPER